MAQSDRYVHQMRLTTSHLLDAPLRVSGWSVDVRIHPEGNWQAVASVAPAGPISTAAALREAGEVLMDQVLFLPVVLPFE